MTEQTSVLIGITGRLGVGKSTLAALIADAIPDARVVAFADDLKEQVHEMLGGWPEVSCASLIGNVEALKGTCLGPIYQGYGELQRKTVGENYWVNRLAERLPERAIVADVRYQNEADWIVQRGGLLVAVAGPCRREGDRRSTDHPSERHVEEIARRAHARVMNDGDLDWLGAEARRLARAALWVNGQGADS